MITYSAINEAIYDFYRKENTSGNDILLAFDDYALRKVSDSFSLSTTEVEAIIVDYLKDGWDKVNIEINGIPQCFGLLAIQVIAAYRMHEDESYSQREYTPRLVKILSISSIRLKSYFEGNTKKDERLQESIWQKAKSHFSREGYNLEIPSPSTHAWRYVKYPLSQVLFNTEDLRSITQYFELLGLRPKERFEFVEFEVLVEKTLFINNNDFLTKHACKVIKDDSIDGIKLLKQVFQFYNSWNGEVYKIDPELTNIENSSRTKISAYKVLLTFFDREITIYFSLADDRFVKIELTSLFNTLSENGLSYNQELPFFFNKLEKYDADFEKSRYLYPGQETIILIDKTKHGNSCRFLKNNGFDNVYEDENLVLYHIIDVEKLGELLPFFADYIKIPNPLKLQYGIKLGRNKWMHGAGPTVTGMDCFDIYKENEKIENLGNNLSDITPGEYLIRTSDFNPIKFEIVSLSGIDNAIETTRRGWSFTDWSISPEYNLEGLLFLRPKRNNNPIRDWMMLNTNRYNKAEILNTVVNKALYRSKNGI